MPPPPCSRRSCATRFARISARPTRSQSDLSQSPPQRGDGYIGVQFGAAPENIGAMTDRVLAGGATLQSEGPPADLVAKAKEGARRDYETALKQNALLDASAADGASARRQSRRHRHARARIEAVTPALVQDTFKKYFPLDRYTVITLLPEAATECDANRESQSDSEPDFRPREFSDAHEERGGRTARSPCEWRRRTAPPDACIVRCRPARSRDRS